MHRHLSGFINLHYDSLAEIQSLFLTAPAARILCSLRKVDVEEKYQE